MNLYVFHDRQQDEQFLANKVVVCPIAGSLKELEKIHAGCSIVIQLSNRKKYKGVVRSVSFQQNKETAVGTMDVVRG
jgi:hypothetical protein